MSTPTFPRHEHGAWCHPAADGCPSEIPAPDLSPAEAARVAEFDAAPEPEEVTVERVARAIYEADSGDTWEDCWLPSRWHTAARAALTALRGDRAPLAGQHAHDWVKARTNGREWLECRSCPERRYDLDEVAREFGVDLSERAAGQHATDEEADRG